MAGDSVGGQVSQEVRPTGITAPANSGCARRRNEPDPIAIRLPETAELPDYRPSPEFAPGAILADTFTFSGNELRDDLKS